MRVSLPAGDPLIADRVVRDSRVLIEGQEFPADLVALDMRDFDVVFGMDWLSRHRATLDCYKKEVRLHRLGKNWRYSSQMILQDFLQKERWSSPLI